ncbi:MAG: putative toxin-antitoxin system toxin component, PIN family [Candidatus Eremiobacteraeota bacterium]|nr:putative toxin-antitoxin system toxin component, PIN family [Candidatus Eremiobacteraeota bacterium]MBC5802296.1 putative toxin-antitoxin system toxin component, PIN family [Candidatus Eremiobacteraeota bacterium]MBC5824935.1 putative toxin-antitoxin system toxin component, PIN family [Candidatus Eremiobacteraeota bacterium]
MSAFRSQSGTSASRLILRACLNGHVQIVTSRDILHENIEVLMRPMHHLPPADVLEFGLFLARTAELVELSGVPQGCRDRNDDMFLETARIGAAEYLVTFDRDLLDDNLVNALQAQRIRVASLDAFLQALRAAGIVTGDTVMPKVQS